MKPSEIIPRFDSFLAEQGLALEAIATGGAALALLGIIGRETRDCDLIEPDLSSTLREASRAFAAEVRKQGGILRDDWLNNGPASLGRPELLLAKLWALCDRGLDLGDCLALAPRAEELHQAEAWIAAQDLNPDWPAHVEATLKDLARRLEHGL